MYEYSANVIKIVDGDTIHCDFDLGFGVILKTQVIRLARINAPETNTVEGKQSKEYLSNYLLNKQVVIKTIKDKKEKYGRFLGEIFLDKINVNNLLVEQGLAKYYG